MDPIANLLNGILNAQRVGKARAVVPYSRFKQQIAELLREKGYVAKVAVKEGTPQKLVVTLKYDKDKGRLHHIRRLSVPGWRRYVGKNAIPYAADGIGMVMISTSQGVIDDTKARKEGLGGELICEVW